MERIGLEICVDTLEGARAAEAGGADRVELCAALSEGGLTPSAGLMRAAAGLGIPAVAMIRPRSGLFHFSEDEIGIMLADVECARTTGLAGVVLGVQGADGALDAAALARLCEAAAGMETSLHRVIDVVPDIFEALEQAIALGFARVLTSGGAAEAPEGEAVIADMVGLSGRQLERRAADFVSGRRRRIAAYAAFLGHLTGAIACLAFEALFCLSL